MSNYDVIIIGAGPGGIFAAYELAEKAPELKVAVFEAGNPLEKRKCPIDGKKIKSCVNCKTCAIMSGFSATVIYFIHYSTFSIICRSSRRKSIFSSALIPSNTFSSSISAVLIT